MEKNIEEMFFRFFLGCPFNSNNTNTCLDTTLGRYLLNFCVNKTLIYLKILCYPQE